jgi:hypothetical protein
MALPGLPLPVRRTARPIRCSGRRGSIWTARGDRHRHPRAPGMTRAQLFLIEPVVLIPFGVGYVFAPHLRRVLASLNRQSIQRIGFGIILGSLGMALVLWLTGS